MSQYRLQLVDTCYGWVAVVYSDSGIRKINMLYPERAKAVESALSKIVDITEVDSGCGDLPKRLQKYFSGERVGFPDVLDMAGATEFQQRVWKATRSIGYGQLSYYGAIAQKIESPKAFRAVGAALGSNRFPIIIPCHRIIRSSGDIGGFSCGVEIKKLLMKLEGIRAEKYSENIQKASY